MKPTEWLAIVVLGIFVLVLLGEDLAWTVTSAPTGEICHYTIGVEDIFIDCRGHDQVGPLDRKARW